MSARNIRESKHRGLEKLSDISRQIHELEGAQTRLASELHEMGVSYRTLSDVTGAAPNTVRSRVLEHREAESRGQSHG